MDKMDIKKYYGPGYWAAMHIESANAATYEEKVQVANTIVKMISTFPCKKCREHGISYAAQHPLIHAVNDCDKMSVFKWVWKFHNNVNKKIGKNQMTFQKAVSLWSGKTFCVDESCE
jgi:hypothetical protein